MVSDLLSTLAQPDRNWRVALWIVFVIYSPAVLPQQPEPASTLSVRSTLVLVPALVRNKADQLVFSLKVGDFTLTDDGIPQKLTLEPDTGGEPLAMVVLIESGAANRIAGWQPDMRGDLPDRFRSVPTMVEAIAGNVPHSIAVVGFDSHPELLQNFTSNFDSVAAAIHDFSEEDAGDHGAAILDALGFAVDLLRKQPPQYRRAILLLSETNDRGSSLPLADALRAIANTNTAIYSVAYSTGFADASHYASKQLPTKRKLPPPDADHSQADPGGTSTSVATEILRGMIAGVAFENPVPYPPGGCMGKDPNADVNQKKTAQAYDCLAQLAPPLALAKMAAIAARDGMRRNIPETIARLTGGEYFKFNDAKSLERDLATISNHVPNRYILSFQPRSPHPGLHALSLQLRDYTGLKVTARSSYWSDPAPVAGTSPASP